MLKLLNYNIIILDESIFFLQTKFKNKLLIEGKTFIIKAVQLNLFYLIHVFL